MEDIKIIKKFTEKNYIDVQIKNSTFDDIKLIDATIEFTLTLKDYDGGKALDFYSLDKVELNYEGLRYDDNNSNEDWTEVQDIFNREDIEQFDFDTMFGSDEDIRGYRLDGITIDVIKKTLLLSFNE